MSTSPERQKLREAQLDVQHAEHVVDEARRAAHHAQTKWSACNSAVAAIEREIAEIEEDERTSPSSSSDRFIAELASGGDVATLEKPPRLDELRAQLADAERESNLWFAARKTAEEAVESRQRALDMARDRVADAARIVADKEVDVAALLASAEAARQATLSELATLTAVAKMLPQASLGRQAIESFLAQGWCAPIAIERAPCDARYGDWFDKLRADASAKF